MQLWRLCRKAFAKQPLSGEGGLYASARWHTTPRRVAYASHSLALACLEVLVHLDPELMPRDMVAVAIDVPEEVEITELTISDLPKSWRRYPAPRSLQRLGDAWLDGGESAVLRVPSVVVPNELNYLINPLHHDARRIKVVAKSLFSFDPRLLAHRRG
jgi:RES domain-containing protein